MMIFRYPPAIQVNWLTMIDFPGIRLMHESAIGGHDQWLPRCRSNIGIGNESVGSFFISTKFNGRICNMEYVM